jgi:23S rRNA (cytidine1920-2'-O)/16S rRNA (cytidine1409-2'-O)-methyltransferase
VALSPAARQRLDRELVRRGLAASREEAQTAIAAGVVLVAGSIADKPSRMVSSADSLIIAAPPNRFVSRGGIKLEAALDTFAVSVQDGVALDAGASTGGFTDCLLQRGARLVYAIDVGYGQLDSGLRDDPRVVVFERTNIREIVPSLLSSPELAFAPVDIVTADLSFISLTTVAPVLSGPIIKRGGNLVVLVKPQFEAGRREVSRGKGVVKDPQIWRETLEGVCWALVSAGTGIMGAMVSPLRGPAGNAEFLVHGVVGEPGLPESAWRQRIEEIAEDAQGVEAGASDT